MPLLFNLSLEGFFQSYGLKFVLSSVITFALVLLLSTMFDLLWLFFPPPQTDLTLRLEIDLPFWRVLGISFRVSQKSAIFINVSSLRVMSWTTIWGVLGLIGWTLLWVCDYSSILLRLLLVFTILVNFQQRRGSSKVVFWIHWCIIVCIYRQKRLKYIYIYDISINLFNYIASKIKGSMGDLGYLDFLP